MAKKQNENDGIKYFITPDKDDKRVIKLLRLKIFFMPQPNSPNELLEDDDGVITTPRIISPGPAIDLVNPQTLEIPPDKNPVAATNVEIKKPFPLEESSGRTTAKMAAVQKPTQVISEEPTPFPENQGSNGINTGMSPESSPINSNTKKVLLALVAALGIGAGIIEAFRKPSAVPNLPGNNPVSRYIDDQGRVIIPIVSSDQHNDTQEDVPAAETAKAASNPTSEPAPTASATVKVKWVPPKTRKPDEKRLKALYE